MNRNVSVQVLRLLENMIFTCYTCVKWADIQSNFFAVTYSVRQGSVLAPFLFAIYLDDLNDTCSLDHGRFIILYADDILLISQSVVDLEKLLHLCEQDWLDMAINFKKILLFTYWSSLCCYLCQHY